MLDVEIASDGMTVWVNDSNGHCIWRFSRWGIDVHKRFSDQADGASECLHCTHERPSASDWRVFTDDMLNFHGVRVGDEHMPSRLLAPSSRG